MKRSSLTACFFALFFLFIFSAWIAAGEIRAESGDACPVMRNRKIRKDRYAEIDGHRIYVCCKSCAKKISKNPDKYRALPGSDFHAPKASATAVN